MLFDARTVPPQTIVDAAICIIGAGAAGTTLAMRLGAAGKNVVLLESGDYTEDLDVHTLNDGEISGRPYPLSSSRLRMMGGTTGHWTGHCYKFLERDFTGRDWTGSPAWPIRLADIDPYYGEASKLALFAKSDRDWSLENWRRRLGTKPLPLDGGVFESRLEYLSPILPSTGHRSFAFYHPELRSSRNIDIYKYATVSEIETDASGRSVTRIIVKTLAGNSFVVQPRLAILAAGGIENARVLLASRKSSPNGIGNTHDQVGRYFTDHVFYHEIVARNPSAPIDRLLQWNKIDELTTVFAHLTIKDEVLQREKIHDVFIRLMPRYAPEAPEVQAAKRLASGNISSNDILTALAGTGTIVTKAWDKLRGMDGPLENTVVVRIEPQPIADSRVTLIAEEDQLGMPKVRLHWELPESAKVSASRAVSLLAQELGGHNLGRVKADFRPESDWPSDLEVGYHHCCTTRMSEGPQTGVVDRNCRVHGVDNLFVAGSSVFTTAGSGSPTMTIVALALRLAEHIKGLV